MDNITLEDFDWSTYREVMNSLVRINENDLSAELSDQAFRYSMFYGLLNEAKKAYDEALHNLDRCVAVTTKDIRSEWISKGKKVTDKAVEAEVIGSEAYDIFKSQVNDANYKVGLLKGLVSSLDQRHSMLIQLSSNNRSETKIYNK